MNIDTAAYSGEVTIKKYKIDENGNESLSDTIVEKNAISYLIPMSKTAYMYEQCYITAKSSGAAVGDFNIFLSNRKIKGKFTSIGQVAFSELVAPEVHMSITWVDPSTDGATPGEWISTKRFLQPVAQRTIRSVFVACRPDNKALATCATLTSPLIQNTDEILEVSYKIYVDVSKLYEMYASGSTSQRKRFLNSMAKNFFASEFDNIASYNEYYTANTPFYPFGDPYATSGGNPNGDAINYYWHKINLNNSPICINHTMNAFTDSVTYVKTIYDETGSMSINTSTSFSTTPVNNGMYLNSYQCKDLGNSACLYTGTLLPSTSTPIQNTFYRTTTNKTAAGNGLPFVDTTNGATGFGKFTISPQSTGSWKAQDNFGILYKINFKSAGSATTGAYTISKRKTGIVDRLTWLAKPMVSSLCGSSISSSASNFKYTDYVGNVPLHGIALTNNNTAANLKGTTNIGYSGMAGSPFFKSYIYPEYISADLTGITIIHCNDEDCVNLDATTIPALPVTKINQIDHDSNGNIYVACGSTGLWKINRTLTNIGTVENPIYSGGVISNITNISPPNCEAAACIIVKKYDDGSIWSIFRKQTGYRTNGRWVLCKSLDYGSTWVEYNENTINKFALAGYTGINDTLDFQSAVMVHSNAINRFAIQLDGVDLSSGYKQVAYYDWDNSTVTSDFTKCSMSSEDVTGELSCYSNNIYSSKAIWLNSTSELMSSRLSESNITGTSNVSNAYYRTWKSIGTGTVYPITTNGTSPYGKYSLCYNGFEIVWNDGDSTPYIIGSTAQSDTGAKGAGSVVLRSHTSKLSTTASATYNLGYSIAKTPSIESATSLMCYIGKGITLWMARNSGGSQTGNPEKGINNFTGTNRFTRYYYNVGTGSTSSSGDYYLENTPGIWEEYGWNGSAWELGNTNSKTMSTSNSNIIDGLQILFTNNNGGTNEFKLNELGMTYVYNGIIKDDATTYTGAVNLVFGPSESGTTFASATVPTETTYVGTNEPMAWIGVNSTDTNYPFLGEPGSCGIQTTSHISDITTPKLLCAEHKLMGDFEIKTNVFVNASDGNNIFPLLGTFLWTNVAAVAAYATGTETYSNIGVYELCFARSDSGTGYDGSSITVTVRAAASSLGTYIFNDFLDSDVFSIKRVGTTWTFNRNGNAFHTISGASAQPMGIFAEMHEAACGIFYNSTVTYSTDNRSYVKIGNGVDTGAFNPRYRLVNCQFPSGIGGYNFDIKINGVQVPNANISVDCVTPPSSSNRVNICHGSGRIWFHAADAGKTISGSWVTALKI